MHIRSLALIVTFGLTTAAMASPITVFGTGQGAGPTDPNYTVAYSATVSTPSPVAGTPAFLTSTGPYTAPAAGTGYISTVANGSSNNGIPGGYYTFTTTFNLSSFAVSSANVFGQFAADNAAVVYLNGVNTGFFNVYGTSPADYGFAHLTSYNLTSGFVAGVNTLQFVVQNGNFTTDQAGPMALDASVSGTATTPEPSSLMLFGTGVLGAAGAIRRRLKK